MKAILFEKFGDSSVLKQSDISDPVAGAGEVLIKIQYTSVNPVDWKIRLGYLKELLPHEFPIIPGWDVAGEVIALGKGSNKFRVGDRVLAYARLPKVKNGTYAEKIALPEDYLATVPTSLSQPAAASIPLVGLTAFQALHDIAQIKAGEQVLITAGAGGVGGLAIQFAKAAGANVTTTASATNHSYLKELGADHVIDYSKGQTVQIAKQLVPNGFDIVLDGAGGSALAEAWQLIKRGGRLVSIVDTPDAKIAAEKNVKAAFHFVAPNGKQLEQIVALIASGKVQVPNYEVRSIKSAAAAQDENQGRHVRGKVVLKVDFA